MPEQAAYSCTDKADILASRPPTAVYDRMGSDWISEEEALELIAEHFGLERCPVTLHDSTVLRVTGRERMKCFDKLTGLTALPNYDRGSPRYDRRALETELSASRVPARSKPGPKVSPAQAKVWAQIGERSVKDARAEILWDFHGEPASMVERGSTADVTPESTLRGWMRELEEKRGF
jgi:hypothetical protein